MLKKLRDLEGQVIELRISVDRDLKNNFFGDITGRIRVIHGELSEAYGVPLSSTTIWVGKFAFGYDTEVVYDAYCDNYTIRVAENDEK